MLEINNLAKIYAPIAQVVEQLPFKEWVVGSNPTGRTSTRRFAPRSVRARWVGQVIRIQLGAQHNIFMDKNKLIQLITILAILVVLAVISRSTNLINMLNIFQKTDSEQTSLGLDFLSKSEFNNFFALVKNDLVNRGMVIGEIKDGLLIAKVSGEDVNFGLINLAQNCKLVNEAEWTALIKNHFDTLAKSRSDDADIRNNVSDFVKVKDFLAVQLYPDDYFNSVGELKNEVITRSVMPSVISTLVFDLPTSIQTVVLSNVKVWNKTEDELFSLALANTFRKITPRIFEQQLGGVKVTVIGSDNYLTAVLVLNLNKYNQCIGNNGSLVAIPTRDVIMCYPINDLGVVKAISGFAPLVSKLNAEGPGSLSSKLYWYKDNKFTNLPYNFDEGKLNFIPPQSFVDMLKALK